MITQSQRTAVPTTFLAIHSVCREEASLAKAYFSFRLRSSDGKVLYPLDFT